MVTPITKICSECIPPISLVSAETTGKKLSSTKSFGVVRVDKGKAQCVAVQILKNTEQIAHKNFAQNLLNRNPPPYFISLSGMTQPFGGSLPFIKVLKEEGLVELLQ